MGMFDSKAYRDQSGTDDRNRYREQDRTTYRDQSGTDDRNRNREQDRTDRWADRNAMNPQAPDPDNLDIDHNAPAGPGKFFRRG